MRPSPNLLNSLFTITIILTFIAGGVSVVSPRRALVALRVGLVSLAAIFSFGTMSTVWFAIVLANAFNPDSGGYIFFFIYHAVLLAYYIFAVATSFSWLPGLPWVVGIHFGVAPILAVLQHSGLAMSGFLGHRLAMMLCFVLLWVRIYDLRRHASAASPDAGADFDKSRADNPWASQDHGSVD